VNETQIAAAQLAEAARAEEAQMDLLPPKASAFAIAFDGTARDMIVSEAVGTLEFPVQLVRKSDGSTNHEGSRQVINIQWDMVTESVVAPTDVAATSGFVSFRPGEVNKTLSIQVVANTQINYGKNDKRLVLRLNTPGGGATVSTSRSQVIITITDDDEPALVSIAASVSVLAGANAVISFKRSGWMAGALRLKFKTQEVTAKANEDFSVASLATLLEIKMEAGQDSGSIEYQTLNAQRGKSVDFRVVLESVSSECAAGENMFLCAAAIKTDENSAVVVITPVTCGDELRGLGERCDDGNLHNEDGCSATCTVESGFVCEPSVDSASGQAMGQDVCTTPKMPPKDSVFIKAKAQMIGVTAEQFVGDNRRIFRQSIADIAKPALSVDKVVILAVLTLQAARRAATLEVGFQMQVPESDKEAVAQSVVNAAADGSLTKKLRAGGLDASVNALSPPEFVSSDGSQGQIEVSFPTPPNPLLIAAVVVVGAVCLITCVGCWLFRKRWAASSVSKSKPLSNKVDIERKGSFKGGQAITGDANQSSTRADAKLLDEGATLLNDGGTAGGCGDVQAVDLNGNACGYMQRPHTSDPSSIEDEQQFLAAMRTSVAPLWSRIVDDFVILGDTEGRFMTEEQVVMVVHGAYDKVLKEAASVVQMKHLKKINRRDFPRLLQPHVSLVGSVNSTDYFTFCETLAPDLLSRRTFQLFCALKEKSGKGACVAEVQHSLMLGRVARDDIESITHMAQLKYPSTVEESERQRILFSDLSSGFMSIASSTDAKRESGPPRAPFPIADLDMSRQGAMRTHTRRGKLERDLQAACDAMAAASAIADLSGVDRQSSSQLPSTGRLSHMCPTAYSRQLAPLSKSQGSSNVDVSPEERLFMSKFQGADATGEERPHQLHHLYPSIPRSVVPQPPSVPAPDSGDEVEK